MLVFPNPGWLSWYGSGMVYTTIPCIVAPIPNNTRYMYFSLKYAYYWYIWGNSCILRSRDSPCIYPPRYGWASQSSASFESSWRRSDCRARLCTTSSSGTRLSLSPSCSSPSPSPSGLPSYMLSARMLNTVQQGTL